MTETQKTQKQLIKKKIIILNLLNTKKKKKKKWVHAVTMTNELLKKWECQSKILYKYNLTLF